MYATSDTWWDRGCPYTFPRVSDVSSDLNIPSVNQWTISLLVHLAFTFHVAIYNLNQHRCIITKMDNIHRLVELQMFSIHKKYYWSDHTYDAGAILTEETQTHWGLNKMAIILETTFSNDFSSNVFGTSFHISWYFVLNVKLTACYHWFRYWLVTG